MPGHLPRPSFDNGSFKGEIKDGAGYNHVFVPSSRIDDQFEEVRPGPNSVDRILGRHGGQRGALFFTAREENSKIDFKVSRGLRAQGNDPTKSLLLDRKAEVHSSSCVPGAITNPISTTAVHSSTSPAPALRVFDSIVPRGEAGDKMVAGKLGTHERKPNASSTTRNDHMLGCSEAGRLGSCLPSRVHGGPMDGSGKVPEHKCTGADSSRAGHKDFHEREETQIHSYQDRQYFSPILYSKYGRYGELGYDRDSQKDLGIPSGASDHDYCGMDSIPLKHSSRLGIQKRQGFVRMETMSQGIPLDLPKDGPSQCGHFCLEGVPPARKILQLERGSILSGNGCLSAGLESDIPVRLPAILFNQSRAQSSDKTEGKQDGANRSNMAVTAMVPVTTVNGSSGTSAASSALKTVVKPFGTRTPLISKLLSESSGLASIRDRLQTDGVSEEVIDLMLNSRRQGTTKSYESAWKNWRLWCNRRGVDPTRCSVNDGLEYLTDLFKLGRPYRTIALHRSAISAYHVPMVVGNALVPVGRHPKVSALMSGVHNLRPPAAKYAFTWDGT